MFKRGGLFLVGLLLLGFVALSFASRTGQLGQLRSRYLPGGGGGGKVSAGDFPAGVAAPEGDFASVPLRPTRIGFIPRGSSSAMLVATGGAEVPEGPPPEGLLRQSYSMDARAVVFRREEELVDALLQGGERGGVDLAALSVDRLAYFSVKLRDAGPRTVLLLGRSRGQEALAAVGVPSLAELEGKRVAVYPRGSAHYFLLWLMGRAGLRLEDVTWVDLPSSLDAGRALREGRADAAVGFYDDLEKAARDRGGHVLATTADAPHLLATVLITRGEFAARYPDAIRRVIRGLLDAAAAVKRDPAPSARLLGEVAPYLGDPVEAISSAPPSDLQDNLAFFGLSGEAPVTYDELYQSASSLFGKIGRTGEGVRPADTRDVGALKYVAEARGR
jgi:ABC-type nitrate/sulfonate/bicarbonate transport system substrate-binding protein